MRYLILILLLINFSIFAKSLTKEESLYFNFIDLNNDEKMWKESVEEDSLYWKSHMFVDTFSMGFYGIREFECMKNLCQAP